MNIIEGTHKDDTLTGNDAPDHIYEFAGNELLEGATGRSPIWEEKIGNDTYFFDIGSSQVTVSDYDATPGNLDTIQLGNGIATTDVSISRNFHDLCIKINGTIDQLTLFNWFYSDGYKIEQVKFADGTIWDVAALLDKTQEVPGNGDDYLAGDSGANNLSGLKGDDTYIVDYVGDVVKEKPNEGNDYVQSSINYILPANVEELTLTGYAAIMGRGNALKNYIFGNNADNILNGDAGDDFLNGDSGNDILNGGAGDDRLYGDSGNDILNGGAGNDWLNGGINGDGNNIFNGGAGDDELLGDTGNDIYLFGIGGGKDSIYEYDTLPGDKDVVKLGTGIVPSDVTISRGVNNLYIKINGTTDQLTLVDWFNSSADQIEQVNFTDGTRWDVAALLANLATDGDDYLAGDSGANKLSGLKGNDIYNVDHVGDEVKEKLNEGADTVEAEITYKLAANLENLTLTGNAAINGTGNALNNSIHGNIANNILSGGIGDDVLKGGSGNDFLNGGAGEDVLSGGVGNDIFQLTTFSIDTITNFSVVEDTIQLAYNEFTRLTTSGPLNASNFIKGAAAADTNDYVIYNKGTGELWFDADGSDPGAATQIAILGTGTTHPALSFADFIVI